MKGIHSFRFWKKEKTEEWESWSHVFQNLPNFLAFLSSHFDLIHLWCHCIPLEREQRTWWKEKKDDMMEQNDGEIEKGVCVSSEAASNSISSEYLSSASQCYVTECIMLRKRDKGMWEHRSREWISNANVIDLTMNLDIIFKMLFLSLLNKLSLLFLKE